MRFNTLVELLAIARSRYAERPLFGTRENGQWVWTTYRDFAEQVDRLRGALAHLGIERGDTVAIISNNRVEWAVLAHACYGLGAALVPMYQAQNPKEWEFILRDSAAKALFCATDKIYTSCAELCANIDTLSLRFGLSLPHTQPESYQALLRLGEEHPQAPLEPDTSDTACLIYTSGTTGTPKGVILSHGNLASNTVAVRELFPLHRDDRSLSFLPWAHSFGQTCELHTLVSLGGSMALCDDTSRLVDYLAEVQPTVLVSVPRIFNRIYDGLSKSIAARPKIIRGLFEDGIQLAEKQRSQALGFTEKLRLAAADRLVFSRVRDRFGGRLKYAFSGGAALSKEVAMFIDNLGIKVYEGYGLTETSPVVSANRPGAHRIGSVGKPVRDVRIELIAAAAEESDHGEIVVHGPCVMQGYHNRPDATAAALTEDGGLKTGDIGKVDKDGFLFITGRVKAQYKLQNGKYVAPAPLEEQLKLSPYVTNVMIYGANHVFNVALVVVDVDALNRWASERGLAFKNTAEMLANSRVNSHMLAEIGERSRDFKRFEQVRKLCLVDEDFTTDNGMLTPTMKIKRRVVMDRYGEELEALYEDAES